ncbi:MAG: DUF3857 domain-containing protein [Bdellovibrionaceae bacterium]|nr:DUF3857 domain-containing protein [Pseudobdellovibrionaceae bacterium]NUM57474.1 DUF3857 domain-containing protein [Pseudobdellovibrionaceae bacterium]
MLITKKITVFMIILFLIFNSHGRLQEPSEASHEFTLSNFYFKISKDATYKYIEEREFKILNESGRRDYGMIKINYSPNTTKIKVLEAYSITDEVKTNVPDSMIEDKAIASSGYGFDENFQLTINFPNVKVGSKLYYKISVDKHTLPLKNFFSYLEVFGLKENLKKQNIFLESEIELNHFIHDPNGYLELENKKEKGKYYINIFLKRPIFFNPIEEKEPYIAKTSLPHIEISTAKDWSFDLLKPIIDQNEAVINQKIPNKFALALEQAKRATRFHDQVNILMNEIQNQVRYFGDWRTIKGGIIPRDLETIVSSGFGDCKDFSALLASLLRELGYKANIAWVYRANPYIEFPTQFPSLSTQNHAITHVELENKDYWFDATNSFVFTLSPPPDIANREAIVLRMNNPLKLHIPESKPEQNLIHVLLNFDKVEKFQAKGKAMIELKGLPSIEWTGSELNQSKKEIENRLLEWISSSSRNVNESLFQPFNLQSRIAEDYKFEFTFNVKNAFYKTNQGMAYLLWENYSLKLIGEELEQRTTDLFLRYPRQTIYHLKFNGKKAINPKAIECHFSSEWVDFNRSIKTNTKLTEVIDQIIIKKAYISNSDFLDKKIKKLKDDIQNCLINKALLFQK